MALSCGYVAQDLLSPQGSSRRCVRQWVRGKMFQALVYTPREGTFNVLRKLLSFGEKESLHCPTVSRITVAGHVFFEIRDAHDSETSSRSGKIQVLTSSESDGNSIPAMITAACPYASHGKVGTVACSYDMATPCRWDPHPRHLTLPLPYRAAPYYTHSYRHHQVPSYA